jgi:hypothetical protein
VKKLPRKDSYFFGAFGSKHRRPVKSASMQQRISRIIEKAELVDANGKRLTSLHGLRATGITLGASASSVQIASEQAGQKDTRVTQDHYIGKTEVEELSRRASYAAVFDMQWEQAG